MGGASERNKVKFFEVLYADLTESSNFNYYVVVSTFVFFNINAWMVLPRIAPESAKLTSAQLWKWRNIANSLVHSVLSGTWAIFNLWKTPELSHAYTAYTLSSLACISFSVGYFIYDFFDMASNHRSRSTCELLIHHSLVTLCLGVSVVTRYYHGYAQIALLVEINSIFLHIRQLLIIQGWNKDNASYKINSYLNLSTFIVFRLLNLVWLIRWLAVHRSEVSFGFTTIAYTDVYTWDGLARIFETLTMKSYTYGGQGQNIWDTSENAMAVGTVSKMLNKECTGLLTAQKMTRLDAACARGLTHTAMM